MEIRLYDKVFIPFISEETIRGKVKELGVQLTKDFEGKTPLFIGVLNGVVPFAADLLRNFDGECELAFVKLTSYVGTESSGGVKTEFELNVDIKNRHVIVLEDIVDTGRTLNVFLQQLREKQPASVAVAAFLVKPTAHVFPIAINYAGLEISDDFVVGYGLDYDGLGRNLKGVYKLKPLVKRF